MDKELLWGIFVKLQYSTIQSCIKNNFPVQKKVLNMVQRWCQLLMASSWWTITQWIHGLGSNGSVLQIFPEQNRHMLAEIIYKSVKVSIYQHAFWLCTVWFLRLVSFLLFVFCVGVESDNEIWKQHLLHLNTVRTNPAPSLKEEEWVSVPLVRFCIDRETSRSFRRRIVTGVQYQWCRTDSLFRGFQTTETFLLFFQLSPVVLLFIVLT